MELLRQLLDEDVLSVLSVNKKIIKDLRPFDSGVQRGLAAKKHPGFVTQKEAERAPWFDLEPRDDDPKHVNAVKAWVRKNKGRALDFHPQINAKKQLEAEVTMIIGGGNSKSITTDWVNTHLIPLISPPAGLLLKPGDSGAHLKIVKVVDVGPTQGEGIPEWLESLREMEVFIEAAEG